MVAVVENCFPAVLLDVQVFLAWDASMHATIFFKPPSVCLCVCAHDCMYKRVQFFWFCFSLVSASEHVSMKTWTFHPITKWARPIIGCGSTWKMSEKKRNITTTITESWKRKYKNVVEKWKKIKLSSKKLIQKRVWNAVTEWMKLYKSENYHNIKGDVWIE